MQTRIVMILIAAAGLAAGCASTELADNGGSPHAEKQYRTGSNIPRRSDQMPDGVQTSGVQASDSSIAHPSMPMPGPGGH
ncbi:MAG TPA: hypothetical protein VFE23_12035 [Usitatibacter sp.]|jgi:hypothetical protein|nr:hypothetical protein [Usitatibacter sp.]